MDTAIRLRRSDFRGLAHQLVRAGPSAALAADVHRTPEGVEMVRLSNHEGWVDVLPFMGGADYLGPELNGRVYRFKFMQNGRVIWVDVDGQSGRIIRRSRPR